MENILFNSQIELNSDMDVSKMCQVLMYSLSNDERIYSYVVYYNETPERKHYTVKYMVSQDDSNNTIDAIDAAAEIIKIITDDKIEKKYIIGYRQPPLDKLIVLLQPMVHKLAKIQHNHWKRFEYEDLCQMCNMAIVELFNKGYYIHKSLVEKTFSNMVLMELRRYSNEPCIISLEQNFNGDDDLEKLTIADVIADEDDLNEQIELEIRANKDWTYEEIKNIIVNHIGQRQFDQLLRGYSNNATDGATRKTMKRIKSYLNKLGITKKELNNRYYG